jgi:hypothetical protein
MQIGRREASRCYGLLRSQCVRSIRSARRDDTSQRPRLAEADRSHDLFLDSRHRRGRMTGPINGTPAFNLLVSGSAANIEGSGRSVRGGGCRRASIGWPIGFGRQVAEEGFAGCLTRSRLGRDPATAPFRDVALAPRLRQDGRRGLRGRRYDVALLIGRRARRTWRRRHRRRDRRLRPLHHGRLWRRILGFLRLGGSRPA